MREKNEYSTFYFSLNVRSAKLFTVIKYYTVNYDAIKWKLVRVWVSSYLLKISLCRAIRLTVYVQLNKITIEDNLGIIFFFLLCGNKRERDKTRAQRNDRSKLNQRAAQKQESIRLTFREIWSASWGLAMTRRRLCWQKMPFLHCDQTPMIVARCRDAA